MLPGTTTPVQFDGQVIRKPMCELLNTGDLCPPIFDKSYPLDCYIILLKSPEPLIRLNG